ncbi:hypothetical protein HQQ81_01190 [Microbacteriaceae bacterium VKM Ac-2854]|nr:hypothetical protein [Microbacteriaceae bacterium VKM Ac-2854]
MRSKILALVIGSALVGVLLLALGLTIRDGTVVLRSPVDYRATTTVLLGGGSNDPNAAQIPGQVLEDGVTPETRQSLSAAAAVYAYLVSGSDVRSAVEVDLGGLATDESISAVPRTAQPIRDETATGPLSLPLLSVLGTSPDPERAEALSRSATQAFLATVAAQQDAEGIAPESRVTLTVTDEGAAVAGASSGTTLPLTFTIVGLVALLLSAVVAFRWLRRPDASPVRAGNDADPARTRRERRLRVG